MMDGHNCILMKAEVLPASFYFSPLLLPEEVRTTQMESGLELQPPDPGHSNILVHEEGHWAPKAKSHWQQVSALSWPGRPQWEHRRLQDPEVSRQRSGDRKGCRGAGQQQGTPQTILK